MVTFTCPRCGGHTFGSSANGARYDAVGRCIHVGSLSRLCHGTVVDARGVPQHCGFAWEERDDHLYFTGEPETGGGEAFVRAEDV